MVYDILTKFASVSDFFVPQHEDFLLALQMNEEQYQKVIEISSN